VEEALRVIDALQFTEEHGEVCPADWHKGDKGLSATQQGIADFLSEE
jgi:peroxiredoxin (alkyl hydroperoxide reductase subunit C)